MTTAIDPTRLVFLVGSVRSGTTLLRLMMAGHPEIDGGEEFEYAFACHRGDRLPSADDYREYLATDRAFQNSGLKIDPAMDCREQIDDFVRQRSAGGRYLLSVVHSRFDRIEAMYPGAKVIHLVRDPRDVARSCVGMGWAGNAYYGVDIWLSAVERWDLLEPQLRDGQHLKLTYESLVSDPQGALTTVSGFLGVGYSDAFFDYLQTSTYSRPDASLANQWRKKLKPAELSAVESKCAGPMERFGYQPATGHPQPSAFARLGLWGHNRLGRVSFNVRRYGLPMYSAYQLSRVWGRDWRRRVRLRMNEVDRQHLK